MNNLLHKGSINRHNSARLLTTFSEWKKLSGDTEKWNITYYSSRGRKQRLVISVIIHDTIHNNFAESVSKYRLDDFIFGKRACEEIWQLPLYLLQHFNIPMSNLFLAPLLFFVHRQAQRNKTRTQAPYFPVFKALKFDIYIVMQILRSIFEENFS